MTTDKRRVSALLLQRQLGLSCYETAWMLLHKLRRAMVNVAREPLRGEVEVDETWIGGEQAGLRGSRQLKGRRAALALVAVERRGRGQYKRAPLSPFVIVGPVGGQTFGQGEAAADYAPCGLRCRRCRKSQSRWALHRQVLQP